MITNIGLLTAEALTGEPNKKYPTCNEEPLPDNDEFETILIGYIYFLTKQWSTAGSFLGRDINICGDQLIMNYVVGVQHFLAANIYLQNPSSYIKTPNTCNCRETAGKVPMNLPYSFHKGLIDEIIRKGALEFIEHGKGDLQEE